MSSPVPAPRYAPLETLGDRVRFALITSGGLGLAPVASGTWGTLGGVALAILAQVVVQSQVPAQTWTLSLVLWGLGLGLLAWGCLQSAFVARVFLAKDPSAFVLDEVVGYLVAVALYTSVRGELSAVDHTAVFVLFRAFDVLKIQPAKRLEAVPGAWGIMLDDVAAGIYAGALYLLVAPWLGLNAF